MLAKSFVVLAAAALSSAKPIPHDVGASRSFVPVSRDTITPTLPSTGLESELPPAPEGQVLKYIALGHGIQNYSCGGSGEAAEATGAVAVLYDVTNLYPGAPNASDPSAPTPPLSTVAQFNSLTTNLLWTHPPPLNSADFSSPASADDDDDSAARHRFGASSSTPFPPAEELDLSLPVAGGTVELPFLGHHIFDADGVPTFYTGEEGEETAEYLLKAALSEKVPAPDSADPGTTGTGAVDWLFLEDAGGSRGLGSVFRVVTAGGVANECGEEDEQSVPYATFYWFYGPDEE